MIISVGIKDKEYDIVLEKGALKSADKYLDLNRKVLIVTDTGVPREYLDTLKRQIKSPTAYTLEMGEINKNMDNYVDILRVLTKEKFTRSDAVIALGGGVVGDIAGFAAATYMRGIDFYNIPTTLLSQVDSSIGGKVAVDFCGVKNIVGAFYQPKKVIIDPDLLKTLDKRQVSAGLCEAIKMAITCDKELFELIEESCDLEKDIETIIKRSLYIKKGVVEKDPYETGLRRVLNFGHTIGHAIESYFSTSKYLHGESVAMGIIPMCHSDIRGRIEAVLQKYSLPTRENVPVDALIDFIKVDKKAQGKNINIIYVKEIGSFEMMNIPLEELRSYIIK